MTGVITPRGKSATFITREGTSDLSVVGSTFGLWGQPPDDEYRLADLRIHGLFVDIGAHVGTVAIAVLLDNPDARAIAIEPLRDNCEMIGQNAEVNGVADRLTIYHAAIGPGASVAVPFDYEGEFASERFIGGLGVGTLSPHRTETVETVRLADFGPIEAMKLDCEGCEWTALAEPCIRTVGTIVGEAHNENDWPAAIERLLGPTHDIEILTNPGGTGTFRATRKARRLDAIEPDRLAQMRRAAA